MHLRQRLLLCLGLTSLGACDGPDPDPCAGRKPPVNRRASPAMPHLLARPTYQVVPGGPAAAESTLPSGFSPERLRVAYGLPDDGGTGTIAIIDANGDSHAEADLGVFSATFGLPECTTGNGCFERHVMVPGLSDDPGWAMEISLDVQWAHAVAPRAKILLVEARSAFITDLMAAIDFARERTDVVAVSMSWGGDEFTEETFYDFHFEGACGMTFFAASGDGGSGVIWPSSSPNVVSVGGTSLYAFDDGEVFEAAWAGSGGGLSKYQLAPDFQIAFGLTGQRAVPDVSANADPWTGYAVYDSVDGGGWYQVGGTSASTPVWAGIKALGLSADRAKFYQAAAGPDRAAYFRDITIGSNGACGMLCEALPGYDTVTGLGSPLTIAY